jgi:hypothetical protein
MKNECAVQGDFHISLNFELMGFNIALHCQFLDAAGRVRSTRQEQKYNDTISLSQTEMRCRVEIHVSAMLNGKA